AQLLARAGLHMAATTVGRMLKAPPQPSSPPAKRPPSERRVTARRPNHVWHVGLTVVPITSGFWTPWLPLSLPQCWPFCWWTAVVVDHFSRRVMGCEVFSGQPTSFDVRALLGRASSAAGAGPKYIVCDKGPQFWSREFKKWASRKGIRLRYGAV